MRPLRTPPLPGGMREITVTTTNHELLLRPSPEVNSAILGVIAKGQRNNPGVRIHAWIFMSTHYHMLISADDSAQMSKFAQFVNCNITTRLNKINERTGTTWAHRYHGVDVSADEATQIWRLRYLLAHGVKENLVARVDDWPGASSLPWLRDGIELWGVWTDYTKKGDAARRKRYVEVPGAFDTLLRVELTVLPCWAEMPPEQWRVLVRDIIEDIERKADEEREATGREPLSAQAVLAADPHMRLPPRRRRRAPTAHAPMPELRLLCARRRVLHMVHREASLRFLAGEWDVPFPEGMFRPWGGYVAARVRASIRAPKLLAAS